MTRTHARLAGFAAALAALTITPACSTDTPAPAPGTVTVTTTVAAPTSAAPDPTATVTATAAPQEPQEPQDDCAANPASWPVPHDEPYGFVPAEYRLAVGLSGIPSGVLTPGAEPAEVEVTLCNDTPVDYPSVGVGLVLDNCSCAPVPGIAKGTVERYDAAAGSWVPLQSPAAGLGMDHLGQFTDLGAVPKGEAVTLRYRVALDPAMTDGEGGVSASAVTADGSLIQIGAARLPFTVATAG